VLVGTKLTMSQQSTIVAKKDSSLWTCTRQGTASRSREVILALSPDEAASGVLGLAQDSEAQEGHGNTGVSSVKGREDDEGTTASLI